MNSTSRDGPPTAIIYLTGSELTRGETHDRNGPFLATRLTSLGVSVVEIALLPDDPPRLACAFGESIERAEIVIVSGGLGPTADDHTVRVLAGVLGRDVVQDPEARERMRQRVLERFREIPDNFFKQAEVVAGSKVLLNPVGLAPGCLVETERGFLVVLPGVPRELRALFLELVVPEIAARFGLEPPRILRAKLLNHPESVAESRIQALAIDFERLEYGISARPGELLVKLIAHRKEDHARLDAARDLLIAEFGENLVLLPEGLLDAHGETIDGDFSRLVHELLRESGRTIATAESCTGGLVGKLLTDHAGSSDYFLGSIVAYDNRIKERILGVDPGTLRQHGAVSEPVCRAMALAARELLGADYGIGITGIAGPGGDSPGKPIGLVYIALAASRDGAEPTVVVQKHDLYGNRDMVRRQAAVRALDLVRRDLIRR